MRPSSLRAALPLIVGASVLVGACGEARDAERPTQIEGSVAATAGASAPAAGTPAATALVAGTPAASSGIDLTFTVPALPPMPVPSAATAAADLVVPMDIFDWLAAEDPGIAGDQDAINGSLAGLTAATTDEVSRQVPAPDASPEALTPAVDARLASARVAKPSADALPAVTEAGSYAGSYAGLGAAAVFLGQMFNRLADRGFDGAPTIGGSETKADGGASTTMSMKVKLADTKGESEFALSADTVVVKDAGGRATSYRQGAGFGFKGRVCPDVNGIAEFEATVAITGETASGPSKSRELKAKVRMRVDDAGDVRDADIELQQGTREKTADGRGIYVRTTTGDTVVFYTDGSVKAVGNDNGVARIDIQSQQATRADAQRLHDESMTMAYAFALGTIGGATAYLQDGGCIRIEATAPATVTAGATTPIAVAVTHKLDGSGVGAKVSVTLEGTKSVVPDVIAKAPGAITHTAGEAGTRSTITLKAASRRGRAELKLPIATEKGPTSYRPVEVPGARSWGGACFTSLAKGPLVMNWKGPAESGVFTLTPTSETRGSLTEVLRVKSPGYSFSYQGKGTYRIEVVETQSDGSPRLLDVVYKTAGKARQCAGGSCTTTTLSGAEAMIPLEVLNGPCPGGE